ncbi:protein of unknown function [Shewanella benthica]|uniref:Uncharacterized protein n=1 Tax=Shewanella benthica TaxID=43661 RepID=A0A330M0A6_9GAMM|nr:protein of unknown function [Shewanella benthica]
MASFLYWVARYILDVAQYDVICETFIKRLESFKRRRKRYMI